MRTTLAAAFLLTMSALPAVSLPILTAQQAAADVLKDGYTRVAFTERAADGWNVWATKDGISYEVRVDPSSGALLQQVPLDSDD